MQKTFTCLNTLLHTLVEMDEVMFNLYILMAMRLTPPEISINKRIRRFFAVPPIKSRDLTVNGVGVQEIMPRRMVERPGGTGDFLFMVFFNAVTIGVNGKMQHFPSGNICIWDPSAGHFYGSVEREWSHSWTHCHGRLIDQWLKENELPRNTPFQLHDPWMCDRYLQELHFQLTHYAQPDEVIVHCLYQSFIRELARAYRGVGRKSPVPKDLLALKSFIEGHYEQPMHLEMLADRVHLSVPHLCAQFKRYFGMSVIAYVIQLRLNQAAYLLQDQTLSVTEIAQRVGYDDIYYFSKLFKNHYGASPRHARRNALAERTVPRPA
jgi:AraC family transcriptional regulator, arabinose operon regulatory protein